MRLLRRLFQRWFGAEPDNPTRAAANAQPGPDTKSAEDVPSPSTPPAMSEHRPALVAPSGEDSVLAYQLGGLAVVMDRDVYEYIYGDPVDPDPAQRDLDEVMAKATRICVLDSGLVHGRLTGGKVLLDLNDAEAIQDLAACLRIGDAPPTFSPCACPGGPTLELYSGGELLAALALQHGQAIRWSRWRHDAHLQAGDRLRQWLERHGIRAALLGSIFQQREGGRPRSPVSQQEQQAEELGTRAERQAQGGEVAEALQLCQQAIQLAPARPEGYALRATLKEHLGLVSEAGDDCSEAILLGMRHAGIYFIRAMAGHAAGQLDQALADCSIALQIDPDHIGARDLRGYLRSSCGQAKEALADLAKAIRLAPTWPQLYWHRIGAYHATENFDGIIADATKIIQIVQAALAKLPPGATDSADPHGGDLSQPRSALAAAYVERASAHERKNRFEAALRDFDEALRILPGSLGARSARGWFHFRRDRFAEAVADFTEVITLVPDDANAYLQRGTAHIMRKEYVQAVDDFTAAIQRDANHFKAYSMRSQAYAAQEGKFDEAVADATEAIHLAPDSLECRWARMRAYGLQGRYEEEIAELETMLRLDPDDVNTCNMLAWRLATCPDGRYRDGQRALALATHGCEKSRWKEPQVMDTLAAAYAEVGQFEEACRHEERSMRLLPPGSDITRYQARLATYRSGQPHRATPRDAFLN
jgi:tetratricopeptide (TPR) repeat protein